MLQLQNTIQKPSETNLNFVSKKQIIHPATVKNDKSPEKASKAMIPPLGIPLRNLDDHIGTATLDNNDSSARNEDDSN